MKTDFFRQIYTAWASDTAAIPLQIAKAEGFALQDLYAADGDKLRLLAAAAASEQGEAHPFAKALMQAAERLSLSLPACEDRLRIQGAGISSRVGDDVYFFGNGKGLRKLGIPIPYAVRHTDFSGHAILYAVRNAEFCGFFLFRSAVCGSVQTLVRQMQAAGKFCLLVGREGDALAVAAYLGIPQITAGDIEKDLHETKKHAKIMVIDGETLSLLCKVFALWDKTIRLLRRKQSVSARLTLEEPEMFGKINYTMKIDGMNCTHCSARVKTALESLRGVSADISLEEKLARIKCPASMDAEKLTAAVTEVGFTVVSVERV